MPRRQQRRIRISDLRSLNYKSISNIHDVVEVWELLPFEIQDAITTIIEATMKRPGKIEARAVQIKRLYLELHSDQKNYPKQEMIVKEIMKQLGISARSTVMSHLRKIREDDSTFP